VIVSEQITPLIEQANRYSKFMKKLIIIISIFFIPKLIFSQKVIYETVNEKVKFKYEYWFRFEQKNDSIKKSGIINPTFSDEIYQINSIEKLSKEELDLIMDCVKKTVDKNGFSQPHKCTLRKKYYLSIQI
jgi:hypothetical protein